MKSATLPSLRVAPELRQAVESVLEEGESLSSFMEQTLRHEIQRRQMQAEFLTRGLQAGITARERGEYHDAATVHAELRGRLDAARAASGE